VAFATTVYLARTLGPGSYGVISLAMAVLLYATFLADAGIEMLGVREVAEDTSRLARLVPAVLSARLLGTLGLVVVLAIGAHLLLPEPDSTTLALYGLCLAWVAVNTRWVHLGLERPGPVALSRVIGEVVVLAVVVGLVRMPGDLARVPLAQFAGDGMAALFLLALLRRRGVALPLRLDREITVPLFARSFHLMWNAVLGLMIFNADLILLRVFRDSATVGQYGVAYTLVSFLLNLGVAYSLSLLPALTRSLPHAEERQSLYDTASAHVFTVALPVAVGGALLSGAIIAFFFGAGYRPSAWALTLLLMSIPVAALRNVPQAALIAAGRQELVLRTTAICAALNLGLNLALIPPFGMTGAAAATGLTEAVRTGITLWFAARHGFGARGLVRLWRAVVAAGAMGAVLYWWAPLGLWAGLAIGVAVFTLALALTGGIRRDARGRPVLAV
jgi:O-antigen/teichoic acid export membrane protein